MCGRKNDFLINKDFQQLAALFCSSGSDAINKKTVNEIDLIKDILYDSENKAYKDSDNAAVAMGTEAWFYRDLSGFVCVEFEKKGLLFVG